MQVSSGTHRRRSISLATNPFDTPPPTPNRPRHHAIASVTTSSTASTSYALGQHYGREPTVHTGKAQRNRAPTLSVFFPPPSPASSTSSSSPSPTTTRFHVPRLVPDVKQRLVTFFRSAPGHRFGFGRSTPHIRLTRIHRSAFIALFLLVCVSVYTIFGAYSSPLSSARSLSLETLREALPSPSSFLGRQPNANSNFTKNRKKIFTTHAFQHLPQISLDPPSELAAVASFIVSSIQSAASLPLTVDPSKPIDPQLVCDFDTRGARALEEVKRLKGEVWRESPVILFKALRSPVGREVKNMLLELNTEPPPVIIDVDQRADAEIVTPLLQRLTAAPGLPILLIAGELAAPSIADLRVIRDSGELRERIEQSGAIINGGRENKKKRR